MLVFTHPTVSRIAAAVFITILCGPAAMATGPAAAPAQNAQPAKILALGTSLTAGFKLPQGQSFTARLEAALREKGYDATVVNAGVSGDTSAGGLARLNWLLSEGYTHAIVELGGNDVLRGLEPEESRANLDAILTTLKEKGIKVLLAGMRAPPNLGPDYEQDFNGLYAELAEKHGVMLYPFFLDGVAAEPALNLDDGIHPNEQGVALIVERMLPYVEELLADG
jgi:acyl-CoA thioesterase I